MSFFSFSLACATALACSCLALFSLQFAVYQRLRARQHLPRRVRDRVLLSLYLTTTGHCSYYFSTHSRFCFSAQAASSSLNFSRSLYTCSVSRFLTTIPSAMLASIDQ